MIKFQYLMRIRIFALSTEMSKLADIREVRLGPIKAFTCLGALGAF